MLFIQNASIIKRNSKKTETEREAHAAYCKKWREENAERYNAQRAIYREANRDKIRKRHAEWHAMFPERKMFNAAKTRAKKNGLDILPLPTKCPVLGILLRKGISSSDDNAYSLDRIDNSKGYVPGNVVVMSRRANVIKRDATFQELIALARWAKKHSDVGTQS